MDDTRSGLPMHFARWRSDTASGGNRYDDQLVTAMRALGVDLREHEVTGPWPLPDDGDRQLFTEMLETGQDWVVDNIVGSAAPETIAACVAAGRQVTLLMHYFPSDDTDLSPGDRQRLADSEAQAVSNASRVAVTSAWAAHEVALRYGRDDAVVAQPGVQLADISPGSTSDGEPPRLLWLARLSADKDPLTFVEALAQLQDLEWTARLVGPNTVDEVLSDEVNDCIARAGLLGRVEVVGAQHGAALESLWATCDLLVHTSLSETYGMVVGEALAHGVPAIVASGTGAVEAQRVGHTFPSGDAVGLAVALRTWLTDPVLRQRWRTDAQHHRRHLPTWMDTARIISSTVAG